MNKVIGTMTVKQEAILVGDHHIVTQGVIADEEAAFAGGTLLYKGESGYQAFASNDETNSPVAVALDALEAAASDAVVPMRLRLLLLQNLQKMLVKPVPLCYTSVYRFKSV